MDSKNLDSDSIRSFKNPQRTLTFIEYSVVQSLVDHVKNHDSAALFAIHGALLCKDDFAIVIVGPGEAGKSTLSCALWQNGWSLLSDDFCFVRDCNQAFPAARRVSLRNGSRDLLGEEIWARIQNAPSSAPTDEGWIFHPHQVDTKSEVGATRDERRAPVRVATFIFLGRLGSGMAAAQMQRHDPARAALSLLPYCTLLERPESAGDATNKPLDWGAALARITPVAARVPVYDLGRGALPEMVSAIESLRASL